MAKGYMIPIRTRVAGAVMINGIQFVRLRTGGATVGACDAGVAIIELLLTFCLSLVPERDEGEAELFSEGYGTIPTLYLSMLYYLSVPEFFISWVISVAT
jgi:hypothetical protein